MGLQLHANERRSCPLQLHVRQTHKAKSKKGTDFVYLVQASWLCDCFSFELALQTAGRHLGYCCTVHVPAAMPAAVHMCCRLRSLPKRMPAFTPRLRQTRQRSCKNAKAIQTARDI